MYAAGVINAIFLAAENGPMDFVALNSRRRSAAALESLDCVLGLPTCHVLRIAPYTSRLDHDEVPTGASPTSRFETFF